MYFEKMFEFKNGAGARVEFFKYKFDHWCNLKVGFSFYKSDYIDLICYEAVLSLFKIAIAIDVHRVKNNSSCREQEMYILEK